MSKNKEIAPARHVIKFVQTLIEKELGITAPPPDQCNIMYGMDDDWCDTEIYVYWTGPMSCDTIALQIQYNIPIYLFNGQQITKNIFIKQLNKIQKDHKRFKEINEEIKK